MAANGPSLGIAMTMREFTCPLCGRQFTCVSGDLIPPEVTVCDACLAELGPLDEVALRREIERRMTERAAPGTPDASE